MGSRGGMRENREGRGGREIVEIVVNSPFVHFFSLLFFRVNNNTVEYRFQLLLSTSF